MAGGDSFEGHNYVRLQPGDINIPVMLRLKACSASTANDGSIPFNSTVISVTYKMYNTKGTASTQMITNKQLSSNKCFAYLSYSSATTSLTDGKYKLTAIARLSLSGLSTGMYRQFDLDRIYRSNR